ncbi:unnamed protein product [Soboliphyme baturini]|uniref:Secreted protein n=1 Tax=Soboliphyme baturini TaxID=241478 RepID=A0A183J692_9BILA|nr:unnamed protein product [Soboliphyme baturini]
MAVVPSGNAQIRPSQFHRVVSPLLCSVVCVPVASSLSPYNKRHSVLVRLRVNCRIARERSTSGRSGRATTGQLVIRKFTRSFVHSLNSAIFVAPGRLLSDWDSVDRPVIQLFSE